MIKYFSGFDGASLLIVIIACVVAIALAFTVHEFAHAFVAHKLGDNTPKQQGRLTLNPLTHIEPIGFIMILLLGFGWARPVEVNPLKFKKYKQGMFLVSIAGVVTNIIFAFIFSGIYYSLIIYAQDVMISSEYVFLALYHLFTFFITTNIVLFVFNLLPFHPLDGFKIVSAYAKRDNKIIQFLEKYSLVFILGLLLINSFTDENFLTYIVGNIETLFTKIWLAILK